MIDKTFFSDARFVLPWAAMATSGLILMMFMGLTTIFYMDRVIHTNVLCSVGEAVVENSDIQLKLSCEVDSGTVVSKVRSAATVLAVLENRTQQLRCNLRRDHTAEGCKTS